MVHGGQEYQEPTLITAAVKDAVCEAIEHLKSGKARDRLVLKH